MVLDTTHMDRGVVFDATQTYRYVLTRRWGGKSGQVCFIMLNPSTADCFEEDATIRRCIFFADSWGWHSIMVVNLFGSRHQVMAFLIIGFIGIYAEWILLDPAIGYYTFKKGDWFGRASSWLLPTYGWAGLFLHELSHGLWRAKPLRP